MPDSLPIARILNSKDRAEGTGVLVGPRLVLTCAHVVDAVIKSRGDSVVVDFPFSIDLAPKTASIAGYFPVAKRPDNELPEDLCLLKLEPDETAPPDLIPCRFTDPDADLSDRKIRIHGFPDDQGKWASGRLVGPIGKMYWQMNHELISRAIAPGYSGAPAWAADTGEAVGLIAAIDRQKGEKTLAHLIPAGRIQAAFPRLFSSEQPELSEFEEDFKGDLLLCLCDRVDEADAFADFLWSKECRECCIGKPQLILVRGKASDSLMGLVRRFFGRNLQQWYRDCLGQELLGAPQECGWADTGKQASRRRHLLRRHLFEKVVGGEPPPHSDIETLTELLAEAICQKQMQENGGLVIAHDISLEHWDTDLKDLLRWYVCEFWPAVAAKPDMPIFQIFLCLHEPETKNMGWLKKRKWNKKRAPAIGRFLEKLSVEMKDKALFLPLPGLRPVKESDISDWLVRFTALNKTERMKRIGELFKGRKEIAMSDVEIWLQDLLTEIR